MKCSIIPKYSKVIYLLNSRTGYFFQSSIKCQETSIKRLPLELRIEPAGAAKIKQNASTLLLSKERIKGRYKFITGIQRTKFTGWFLGNDYEYYKGQKVVSIMLFHFTDNKTVLQVFYFYRFDKPNTLHRLRFA